MLKKSASADKRYSYNFLTGCLAIVICSLIFFEAVQAQGNLDLTKPFKKCRVYEDDSRQQFVASDNELNIIFQTGDSNFYSFDLKTNLENWRFQSGGKIESSPVSDGTNLYFISSVVSEAEQESFFVNSLSLKTGVIKWQRKINDYSKVELLKLTNKNLIFIVGDVKYLIIAQKDDGEIKRQAYDLRSSILSATSLSEEYIAVLTAESLVRISVKTGEMNEKMNFREEPVSESILEEKFSVLGNSVGEIQKLDVGGSKGKVFWKVKTGGSISGLLKVRGEVLATSLDNFIYLFSLDSGKLKWKQRVSGRIKIKPLIVGGFAIVVTDGDSSVSIVNLRDGRVINKIDLEADNYFSGQPIVLGSYLIVQTYKKIFFFVNGAESC